MQEKPEKFNTVLGKFLNSLQFEFIKLFTLDSSKMMNNLNLDMKNRR